MEHITIKLDSISPVTAKIASNEAMVARMDSVMIHTSNIEFYDGEYKVIPLAKKEITLFTKNKTMSDDVSVKRIPRYETSNDAGGETFYIAEVN